MLVTPVRRTNRVADRLVPQAVVNIIFYYFNIFDPFVYMTLLLTGQAAGQQASSSSQQEAKPRKKWRCEMPLSEREAEVFILF